MRVACYARYSSDLQKDTSIEDQLRVAREYAVSRNWEVLKDHIYRDAAVSGGSIEGRVGVQRLLAAAAQKPRPFDVVLVDDSSRIARDIADAIRVMQQLKFLGVRVIYISQGIDSASEQADALIMVHGLIDSLYLKELAKKIKRGLAGQIERGFATGAKTYGYRTVPVPDPSGKKDSSGGPALLGKRIEIDPDEASVIRRVFEWAADGVGVASIVERLNRERARPPRGARWAKGAVNRLLANERYLGKQIWGQRAWEREPGTMKKVARAVARDEWKSNERPDLRIISEELWKRAHATRAAVRQAVAPKRNLARGKDARFHSPHVFTGFMKCAECGGTISSVSGGKGSPRFGCARSWNNGPSSCSNRLTIRAKIAEPQMLAKLQAELVRPEVEKYVLERVQTELAKRRDGQPQREAKLQKELKEERRKLQNLVSAIEGGAHVPSLMAALKEREAAVAQLEAALRRGEKAAKPLAMAADLPSAVAEQLRSLHQLLLTNPERTKSEFRRLNLKLEWTPIEAEPRPYIAVKGQCDLSALAFSVLVPAERRMGAVVGLSLGRAAVERSWSRARFTHTARDGRAGSAPSTARR
ncbi:MAG: hypothetical protein DMF84_09080 [Acidobacteria bacterium]|nr:MAG: hypothetical protein DMF84_09080 [Acidobacteriota bacterium]